MSSWFKRTEKGIQTPTEGKKDVPKGLWYKTPTGKIIDSEELARNFFVSPEDGYHVKIGSKEYFEILFDDNEFEELFSNISSKDPLNFVDTKKYDERLVAAQEKTGLKDAIRVAVGDSKGDWYSKEVCGGPHVSSTKNIGRVKIIKQEKVGAGIVRIYATNK
jgi:acetyl-CoA carboxylase carboxyl transferase subunit beta